MWLMHQPIPVLHDKKLRLQLLPSETAMQSLSRGFLLGAYSCWVRTARKIRVDRDRFRIINILVELSHKRLLLTPVIHSGTIYFKRF